MEEKKEEVGKGRREGGRTTTSTTTKTGVINHSFVVVNGGKLDSGVDRCGASGGKNRCVTTDGGQVERGERNGGREGSG